VPTYIYRCKDCSETFEVRHSMSEKCNFCNFCKGENIFKVPYVSLKKVSTERKSKTPGKIVDEYIQKTKEDVREEKKRMKNEEV